MVINNTFLILGSFGSFLGRWRYSWRDFILACCYSVRCYVWPNSISTYFHDCCFRCHEQWRHNLCYNFDNFARIMWYVLRICHLSHLRTGEKCNSVGSWFFLSNTLVIRCNLAHRGNAICFKVGLFIVIVSSS
jgi:hypothetical protein